MSGRIILSTGRRLDKKITATGTYKQVREGGVPLPDTYVATHLRQEVGSHSGPTKRISSLFFRFFHFFSLFFAFFLLFLLFFALNFSLCFVLVIFASKRSEIQVYFFAFLAFFTFFCFFRLFFTFFRLIFVLLRFFHLIFAYFTFVFASDFWCFASK